MTILALDLGTKTGWAINDEGVIRSGMEDFTPTKYGYRGSRYLDFSAWLCAIYTLYHFESVYYEMPHMRGRWATEALHGYLAYLYGFLAPHDIDPIAVHSGTIKKFATGNGKASKEEMIVKAQEFIEIGIPRGKTVRLITDDNEADAICLLKYAESQLEEEK